MFNSVNMDLHVQTRCLVTTDEAPEDSVQYLSCAWTEFLNLLRIYFKVSLGLRSHTHMH